MYASTAQTPEPTCTHDSSNDAVFCNEVSFGGRVYTKLHLGDKTPQNPQIFEPGCQISSQINTLPLYTVKQRATETLPL